MNAIVLLVFTAFSVQFSRSTLSPPQGNANKKENGKINAKKGSVEKDVIERGLLTRDLRATDILKEAGLYCERTSHRRFRGEVLGFITPWNGYGYDVARTFHGKFTKFSPVWLTFSDGNASKFQLSPHDIKKKWLKDMRTIDNMNHSVQILPRVLFEQWSPDDILRLHSDVQRQTQLVSTLVDTAKNFRFDGYVLELWNQFVFTGVNTRVIVSLIKSLARKLSSNNLSVILAIPPSRGMKVQLFSREQFEELAPYINAFSLMTYDYSSIQQPGPNSPLNWARQCIESLVPQNNDPRRAQILLGINFYGYNYTPEGGGAIIGSDYLKLVKSLKKKIRWDDNSKEHFFEAKSALGSGLVFYPTIYSLKYRLDLAEELGTGVSIWELGQGLSYFYDLL